MLQDKTFLVKQQDRSRWVKAMSTIHVQEELSDHKPKSMKCNLHFEKKKIFGEKSKSTNVNWDRLRQPMVASIFRETVDSAITTPQVQIGPL